MCVNMSPLAHFIYFIIVSNNLKPMSISDIAQIMGLTYLQIYDTIRYESSKGNFIFEKYKNYKPHKYSVNPEYLKYE